MKKKTKSKTTKTKTKRKAFVQIHKPTGIQYFIIPDDLEFNPTSDDTRPLAKYKVSKTKFMRERDKERHKWELISKYKE